jgi:penicillin-binding protein-related factor A (putative recombinase)
MSLKKGKSKKVISPLRSVFNYVQKKKKLITRKPVGVSVKHTGFDKHEMAHIVAHPTIKNAKAYTIVYKDTFYNRNKNKNPQKLKQIAAHELAHIKNPNTHNEKFKKTATKLGAGKYNDTGKG